MSGWGQQNTGYSQQQGYSQQAGGQQQQQQYGAAHQYVYGGQANQQQSQQLPQQVQGQSGFAGYSNQAGQGSSLQGAQQNAFGQQTQAAFQGASLAALTALQASIKPSIAAQAVQGLAPDQQAKLSQIMAQVQGNAALNAVTSTGFNNAAGAGYQYGTQATTSQAPTQAGSSNPTYGQYTAPAAGQQAYGQVGAAQHTAQGGYGQGAATGSAGFPAQQPQGYASQQTGQNYQQAPGGYNPPQQQSATAYTSQPGFASAPQQPSYGLAAAPQPTAGQPGYNAAAQQAYNPPQALQQPAASGFGQAYNPPTAPITGFSQPETTAYGRGTAATPQSGGYGQGARPAYNPPSQFGRGQTAAAAPQRPSLSQAKISQSANTWRQQTGGGQSTSNGQKASYGRGTSSLRPSPATAAQYSASRGRLADPRTPSAAPAGRSAPVSYSRPAASRSPIGASSHDVNGLDKRFSRDSRDGRDPRDRYRGREREREKERGDPSRAPPKPQRSREPEARSQERVQQRRIASPPPRKAPPPPEYAVKIASRPFETLERDYMETVHRYSKLYVPADFSKSVSCWTKEQRPGGSLGCRLIALDHSALFEHVTDFQISPNVEYPVIPPKEGVVNYNARVALLCGLDEAAKKDLLRGPSHGGSHLHHLLKFVTVRSEKGSSRAGITLLGGPVDPAADGEPSRSPEALIKACMRYARLHLDLDLSKVERWVRFVEVHYQRPPASSHPNAVETDEVTVVFLVDAAECLPSPEEWPEVWAQQQAWVKAREDHDWKVIQDERAKREKERREKDEPLKESEDKAKDTAKREDVESPPDKPAEGLRVKAEAAEEKPATEEKPDIEMKEPEEAAKSETESAGSQPGAVKAEDPSEAENAPKAEEAADAPKAPEQAVVLAKGRSCENKEKWRSACISLDGLLDYDEEDRDEGTLEMNIFAENFTEMLSQSYGQLILDALYAERSALLRRREERKRKRDEDERRAEVEKKARLEASERPEQAAKDSEDAAGAQEDAEAAAPEADAVAEKAEEAPEKSTEQADNVEEGGGEDPEATLLLPRLISKTKQEQPAAAAEQPTLDDPKDETMSDAPEEKEAAAAEATEANPESERKPEAKAGETRTVQEKPETKEEARGEDAREEEAAAAARRERPKRQFVINENLMLAFRYFDKTGTGYIKVDDLRKVLHNLGLGLSHRTAKELCLMVAEPSARRPEKIFYRELYEKEVRE